MMPVSQEAVELALDHLWLAERRASSGGYGDPAHDSDDVYQDAAIGLLDAAERFDASRGVPFRLYADRRTRGAVGDARRELDPVSRSTRELEARIRDTLAELEQELGRVPSWRESCARLELDHREVARVRSQVSAPKPLDAPAPGSLAENPEPFGASLPDPRAEAEFARLHARAVLDPVVSKLPARYQFMIRCRYFLGMQVQEIGALMGVGASMASRIHSEALDALRELLFA